MLTFNLVRIVQLCFCLFIVYFCACLLCLLHIFTEKYKEISCLWDIIGHDWECCFPLSHLLTLYDFLAELAGGAGSLLPSGSG